jgi:FtsP/CotA-like multicopper oxidase with cupredoxin domain/ketosteroid isomerase-like protein
MKRRHRVVILSLVLALVSLAFGLNPAYAGPGGGTYYANSPAGGVTGTALRKFVDSLPGLGYANRNNLGQYIPVAIPDTTTYPGADYYVLGVKQYTQRMHSDLPKATTLRGYYQSNTTDATVKNVNQYLGPFIFATQNRPVRLLFTNSLPTGTAGNLFIPVDTSIMGAGMGPLGAAGGNYTQNRVALHLHGGNTPWISDGTPMQWFAPAGENTPYTTGASFQNVPDMPTPPAGSQTLYWTNQQSGRFMFYHDHAYGITRLNVYAGMAAGYLITDPVEDGLINNGTLPNICGTPTSKCVYRYGIPLVIQDKTFVPQNIVSQPATTLAGPIVGQDDKWDLTQWGQPGDLWFPHVYEANQDPYSPSGANPFGRWDYGPWFWPPVVVDAAHSVIPTPSTTPEAFMDTPIVNGTAYPYVQIQPRAYRFRILNACNDRTLNLSIFYADPGDPTGKEMKMVPAAIDPTYPPDWPTDGRDGGVPDPATVGPNFIQIGSESGFLPNPVVIPNRPIGYEYNRRNIVVLNTSTRALMLGPAERADVIVDFSGVPAGSKLILYNDGPAPNPAFDPRYDYYTGDPDNQFQGGAASTLPGYGPNTRTIMQFIVTGAAGPGVNLATLQTAIPAAFKADQPVPVVPESQFNNAYGTTLDDNFAKIQDFSATFTPIGGTVQSTIQFENKAIQELWDPYGRMNATLGLELPFTNSITQTTIPMGYAEPPTEVMLDGQATMWKITHNGVDTHPVHFHLVDVQVLNRVGWDGAIRPPDDNELGYKETIRMNPLEDVIVAFRPHSQTLPFTLPTSTRMLDVTQPAGAPIATTDMSVSPPVATTVPNALLDYGYEYVWHCHILGHEENDFMRPVIFRVPTTPPAAPTGLVALLSGQTTTVITGTTTTTANPITEYNTNEVILTWTDNSNNLATFRVERAPVSGGGSIGTYVPLTTIVFNPVYIPQFTDTTINSNTSYAYRVFAFNAKGDSLSSNVVQITTPTWSKATSLTVTPSKPSPHIMGTNVIFTAVASGPSTSMVYHYRFSLAYGGTTTVVQNYSTYNTWALPDTAATGTYTLTVDCTSGGTLTPTTVPDQTTVLQYIVVVPPQPIISPNFLPGVYTGPTVTLMLTGNTPVNIYYTVNGTVPSTLSTHYTTSIPISTTTTLNYYGIDANGTASVVTTATYTIHSPDIVSSLLINNGAFSTPSTTVNLTINASDPTGVATMQFSNDNINYSPEELYAPTKVWDLLSYPTVSVISNGTRTVYVRLRDNSLPTPGYQYPAIVATINYDTVPPVTTARPVPQVYSAYAAPLSVTLTPNEAATTYYTIDGSAPTTTSNVYTMPITVSANTQINYFSVDLAGNMETYQTSTWTFDYGTNIAATVLINGGAKSTNTDPVTLTLSATPPPGVAAIQAMQFSNDGLNWSTAETYTTTKVWSLATGTTLFDGPKTVFAKFQDTSPMWSNPFVANIALMRGGPVTTASPIPGIYSTTPLFVTLTPNTQYVTIYYTADGSTPTSDPTSTTTKVYTSPIQLLATTTLKYFGVDIGGNVEPVNTQTWTISAVDLTASVGINNGALLTSSPTVTLNLSATDPAGVATMQFSNDGVTYSTEEAYATTKAWTLSPGDGLKTVYVRFRDMTLPTGFLYNPVTANITLDTTPPVSTPSPIPGDYSSPPVSVTFATNEPATIYYTIDGSAPTTASTVYSGPISVATTTTIRYFAVDLAGNAEAAKAATYTMHAADLTATMLIDNGSPLTTSTTVTLTLNATDPVGVATMQFSNDGVNFTPEETYAATKAWTLPSGDGLKTVYVRFRDKTLPTGVLYTPVTASITLDTTPPVTTATPISGNYSVNQVAVSLISNETSSIFYTTDGTTPTTASTVYSGPIVLSTTTTIKYFGVDLAGNVEAVKTGTWSLMAADMTASVAINTGSGSSLNGGAANQGAAETNSTAVTLALSASDPVGVSAMQFSNDGITYSAEEPYAATKAWTLTTGDGKKTVYVRFRDASLPSGLLYPPVTASITLDTVAPVTTASPAVGDYAAAPVSVILTASEPGTTYYTTDGTTPTTASPVYTAPILVNANTTIQYFSVDLAGNVETVKSGTWTIHVSDMKASVQINGGNQFATGTAVTLSILATDPTGTPVSMQFSNDGISYTAEEPFATSRAWTLTPGDGLKTVYVRLRDASLGGGYLYPPVTSTITLDTTAPVTTASPVTGTYSNAPIFVTLSSNETTSIYYTTNGTTPIIGSSPYTGPISVSATTTIKFFGVDVAGNVEAVKSGTWTIHVADMTASVQINNGATRTNNSQVNLALSAIDPAGISTMQFSNDGINYSVEEPYATSKVWTLAPGDGLKTVYVRFRDATLPTGALYSPVTASITLDTTPPVTTAGPVTGTYSTVPVAVTLTASEPSVIYYTTDGTQPSVSSHVYTGPISISATTTVKYFAVDLAGNVETMVNSGIWTIVTADLTASVSINNAALYTNNAAVNLTLSANDPVGVATMQFSNDGVNYSAEEPYATTKAWTLTPGDGVKTVYVRFRDATLPTGQLYGPFTAGITVNTTMPVTTASPVPGDYSASPVVVTLSASEAATIYYTTDGTVPTTASNVYTGPISLTANTTIRYFAMDLAGNVEAVKSGAWTIDVTPDLVASIAIDNGAAATNSTAVNLTLSAVDPAGIATMQFSNDGVTYSAEEPYATAKAWTLPSGDGAKTVYVRFRDMTLPSGYLYPPVAATIRLDTVGPITTASPVAGLYSTPTVSVVLASNKPATIYYTTDGTMPTTASAVYTNPIVVTASNTINFFAIDAAGNAEPVKTGTWSIHAIDISAAVLINNGAPATNSTAVTLNLSAIDPAGISTMQFSNDGVNYSAEEPYTSTKAWTFPTGDGTKTVYVRFRDNTLPVGDLYSPVTASIILDTVAPTTTAGPIPGVYAAAPVYVTLTSSETATIFYTADGSTPTSASPVYTGPMLVNTSTTIKYFGVDAAGNAETVKSGTWTIHVTDLTASVQINSGAARSNSPSVMLNLNATDPQGIATMQFSNDGVTYSAEEPYATSKAWTLASGDGTKTVYVRFRDNALPAGNQYDPVSASIILDTVAPVSLAAPNAGIYSTASVTVTLMTNEPATIYYTTDGSTPTTSSAMYTSPIYLASTATIKYFAVDLAGNIEAVNTGKWTVGASDLAASIKINNAANETNSTTVNLEISATDPTGVATMQFSNDGVNYTAEEMYKTSKTWTLSAGDGLKTVYVRFRDNALPTGTLYAPVTASIMLDTTAPVTTAGPNAGTYATVPMSVTLSTNETATIYYTTDGTTPTTSSTVYAGPISLPVATPTTIEYFAVDTVGNVETVKSGTWTALPDGNLGNNGTINDALKALLIAANIVTPSNSDLMHGDVAPIVNGKPRPDGKIDIGDVVVLLRKAMGLVSW